MPIEKGSISLYLSGEQNQLVSDVEEKFKIARDGKSDVMRKFLDFYKIYNCYVPKPKGPKEKKRARIASPQAFSAVEHTTAKMKGVLFPNNENQPIIRAIPQEEEDTVNAPIVEQVTNYDLQQANIRYKGEIWLRNFNIFGVCPVYPYYRKHTAKRFMRLPVDVLDPLTGAPIRLGLGEPQLVEVTLFDGPDFDVGDIEDFFPDPASRSFLYDDMRWVIRRFYRSYEALKMEVESNPDLYDLRAFQLLDANDPPPSKDSDNFSENIVRYHTWPLENDYNMGKGVVELLQLMTRDKLITIANRMLPIQNIDNPYWIHEIPCIVAVRLPITNYPWGKGLIEPIEKTMAHMNALRNARLDTINLNVNPPWKIMKGMVNKSQLETIPNGFIEVTNMNALEKVEIQDTTSQTHIEEERMRQDVEEGTNTPGLARGETPSANIRSASQQFGLLEVVAERTQMDIDAFAVTGLQPLARWFYALRTQFMTKPIHVRVGGMEEGYKYPLVQPHELYGNFDFKIVASARTTPKAIEAQQKLNFISGLTPILSAFPDLQLELIRVISKEQGYLDIAKALKAIILEIGLIRITNGGMLGVGSAGGPNQQGGRGKEGKNTAPKNTPNPDNLISAFMNANSPPDIEQ